MRRFNLCLLLPLVAWGCGGGSNGSSSPSIPLAGTFAIERLRTGDASKPCPYQLRFEFETFSCVEGEALTFSPDGTYTYFDGSSASNGTYSYSADGRFQTSGKLRHLTPISLTVSGSGNVLFVRVRDEAASVEFVCRRGEG